MLRSYEQRMAARAGAAIRERYAGKVDRLCRSGMFLARSSFGIRLDLELAVLDPADVAVDDAGVVLLADHLVALRMAERVLHLHAFERLDRALDVLAGLVARGLDRRLDGEHVLPALPAVALVHHARAADLAAIDVVDADQPVELLVVLVVLVRQHAREVLEEVHAFGGALDVARIDRSRLADDENIFIFLSRPMVLAWV